MTNSQQPIQDHDSGNFEISRHAKTQLVARWPETVLPFTGFDSIVVPRDARIIGYDPTTSTLFLDVPNSPMVALVSGDIVVTVLTADAANARLKLHGFGSEDFRNGGSGRGLDTAEVGGKSQFGQSSWFSRRNS